MKKEKEALEYLGILADVADEYEREVSDPYSKQEPLKIYENSMDLGDGERLLDLGDGYVWWNETANNRKMEGIRSLRQEDLEYYGKQLLSRYDYSTKFNSNGTGEIVYDSKKGLTLIDAEKNEFPVESDIFNFDYFFPEFSPGFMGGMSERVENPRKSKLRKIGAILSIGLIVAIPVIGSYITQTDNVVKDMVKYIPDKVYGNEEIMPTPPIKDIVPNKNPVIIFRLDDAVMYWNKTIEGTQAVTELFDKMDVPLDVGVIPHSGGIDSYKIQFLKDYANRDAIDISMHGCTHDYGEFDTAQSGKTYEELLKNLIKSREEFKEYFGEEPIAITIPFDMFNEAGYKAAQNAGFIIFSSQQMSEPYPSRQPVDYHGNFNKSGMYRLPAVIDVNKWDSENEKWGEMLTQEEIMWNIKYSLNNMNNVAVVSIHPQNFVDEDKKINTTRISALKRIVQEAEKYGEITTFEDWYYNDTVK